MSERERLIIENVRLLAEEALGSGRPEEIRLARDILNQLNRPSPALADLINESFLTDPKPHEDF